jgi:hypothetical protein
MLRYLTVKGKSVVAWGTVPLQDSALLRSLKGRVIIDVPLPAPLVRTFHMEKVSRRYLAQVVLSEVAETLPFASHEVDVAWVTSKNSRGREVWAFAVPRETLDRHLEPSRHAGVRIAAAYAKGTALAAVSGLEDGILVHFMGAGTTVLLVVRGAPLVAYSVDLPVEDSAQVQAENLSKALAMVSDQARVLHPLEDRPLPVALSGEVEWHTPLTAALQPMWGPFWSAPPPALSCPEEFPVHQYAVNLGLVLADQGRVKPCSATSGRRLSVPLLPERYQGRGLSRWVVPAMAAVLLVTSLGLGGMRLLQYVNAQQGQVAALSAQVARLEEQERQQRLERLRAGAVQRRAGEAEQLAESLSTQIARWREENAVLVNRLAAATQGTGPSGVQPSSIALDRTGLVVAGKASTTDQVLGYAATLRAAGLFATVQVVRLDAAGDLLGASQGGAVSANGVQFQLKAALPEEVADSLSQP